MWEFLMCRGDIHVWEILTCGGDIHVWELHGCGGDVHIKWELLTCVGRTTKVNSSLLDIIVCQFPLKSVFVIFLERTLTISIFFGFLL